LVEDKGDLGTAGWPGLHTWLHEALVSSKKSTWRTADFMWVFVFIEEKMPLSCKICGNKAILKRPKTVSWFMMLLQLIKVTLIEEFFSSWFKLFVCLGPDGAIIAN